MTTQALTAAQMREARGLIREYGYKDTISKLLLLHATDPEKAPLWKAMATYLTKRHASQVPKPRYNKRNP